MMRIRKTTVSRTLGIVGVFLIALEIVGPVLGLALLSSMDYDYLQSDEYWDDMVNEGGYDWESGDEGPKGFLLTVKDEEGIPINDAKLYWLGYKTVDDGWGPDWDAGVLSGYTGKLEGSNLDLLPGPGHERGGGQLIYAPTMNIKAIFQFEVRKEGYIDSEDFFVELSGVALLPGETPILSIEITLYGGVVNEPENAPTGYFKINGVKVTEDSLVAFPYKQVALDFYVTSPGGGGYGVVKGVFVNVENIAGELIEVKDIDGNMQPMPFDLVRGDGQGDWRAQFDLPREGRFAIKGYVKWDPGEGFAQESTQYMSLLSGDFKKGFSTIIGPYSIIGLIFIASSVVSSRNMRKRK